MKKKFWLTAFGGALSFCILAGSLAVFSDQASAESRAKRQPAAEDEKEADGDEGSTSFFRCERIRRADLKVSKSAMIANCNLDKPFGISDSSSGIDVSFTYCCHRKKGK